MVKIEHYGNSFLTCMQHYFASGGTDGMAVSFRFSPSFGLKHCFCGHPVESVDSKHSFSWNSLHIYFWSLCCH